MAGENTQEATKTSSVQDIASMLLQPVEAEKPVVEQSPEEGTAAVEETSSDDEGYDAEDQEEEALPSEGESEEADDDEDDAQEQIIDIQDEDLIDVMIDGKLEQRTIAELKKAIAGEGAIEKRLQEATELRKTAHAERTTKLEELAAQERIVANAIAALEDTAFKPLIPPPDPSMKDKNPAAYLRHKDAYDADQKRIADGKAAAQRKIEELNAQRNARLQEYGAEAAKHIATLIPELTDPKKAPAMLDKMVATAKSYGYSEAEISAALDPRMFHLVRDAMRYRDLANRSKEIRVDDLSSQGRKVPRKLRSGNTKAASVVQAQAKQQAQVKKVAAQTGKVSDVAKLLLAPKGR